MWFSSFLLVFFSNAPFSVTAASSAFIVEFSSSKWMLHFFCLKKRFIIDSSCLFSIKQGDQTNLFRTFYRFLVYHYVECCKNRMHELDLTQQPISAGFTAQSWTATLQFGLPARRRHWLYRLPGAFIVSPIYTKIHPINGSTEILLNSHDERDMLIG